MRGVFEAVGVFKLGNGGMTTFARAILDDFRGHIALNREIRKIHQAHSHVELTTKDGQTINARRVVCTIPL